MSVKSWNFDGPEDIRVAKFEVYNQLINNSLYLEKEQLRINSLKTQNDISLINYKKTLYSDTLIGINPMVSLCEGANRWLSKLEKKEVRKNAKNDDDKASYQMVVNTIEMATGIKVKEITKIIFYGYKWCICIYFIDKKYGMKLRLDIPNLRCVERFSPSICNVVNFDEYHNISDILKNLETVLYFVKKDIDCLVELDGICSFPGIVKNLEDFESMLDKYCEENRDD